jgi:hypothetical protein
MVGVRYMGENKYYCPCCGYKTLSEERSWGICEICFWEDDPIQFEDPDYEGDANVQSLIALQIRMNVTLIGNHSPRNNPFCTKDAIVE